jgi:hypothetical protein
VLVVSGLGDADVGVKEVRLAIGGAAFVVVDLRKTRAEGNWLTGGMIVVVLVLAEMCED